MDSNSGFRRDVPGRLGSIKSTSDSALPVATRRHLLGGDLTRDTIRPAPESNSQSPAVKKERTFTPNVNAPRKSQQPDAKPSSSPAIPLTMTLIRMAQTSSARVQEREQADGTAARRRRAQAQNQINGSNTSIIAKYVRKKERKEGKSLDINDISWSNEGHYTPSTLPFVTPDSRDPNRRPRIALVDEAAGKAGHLFHAENDGNSYMEDRSMILLQLPATLPAIEKMTEDGEKVSSLLNNSRPKAAYKSSSLWSLPPGHIGRMQIHKSGKVTMLLGGIKFEVNHGVECHFAQEVVAVASNEEMMRLGPLMKKAVVTPDIIALTDALKVSNPLRTE